MFMRMLQKIFGSRNDRLVKQYRVALNKVNDFEQELENLGDDALCQKTQTFKDRLASGETLEDIKCEAFAVVREAAKRVLRERHYDVQIVGGLVLHDGKIAEMSTGEGKTLTSTLPCYLNGLTGRGVHLITVNDYLAKRDHDWMGQIYRFLGLTTGVVVPDITKEERKKAYDADIVYGTNSEFGFDYLRDNMAFNPEGKVQRAHVYAVVDEVDSILIDEARTPLIISGPVNESSDLYQTMHNIVRELKQCSSEESDDGDFTIHEKERQVHLTDQGHQSVEDALIEAGLIKKNTKLFDSENINLLHYCSACLRANFMFKANVDYIVRQNQVLIIDEHTGRAMSGRRWSDGLHQAVEAKEGVEVQKENQTLASITYQNYFLLYEKLSGMTGTADTEAVELNEIYNLEVVIVPTNKPTARTDHPDVLYLKKEMKYQKILEDLELAHKKQQPVLVGTTSIENSEYLSSLLKKKKIKHNVLNAKFHEQEAFIIAQAGCLGAITIATNMAGRGTDIILGGNPKFAIAQLKKPDQKKIESIEVKHKAEQEKVRSLGGLYVLGTERHESRRIDNQLRGRSGRQGDPGVSRFYLSLDDNLMRIFATDMTAGIMQKVGMKDDEPLTHPWFNRVVEKAQRKVEGHHYDIRKQLLQFDNIANDQRQLIYEQRNELMALSDVTDVIQEQAKTVFRQLIDQMMPNNQPEERWDIPNLETTLANDFKIKLDLAAKQAEGVIDRDELLVSVKDEFKGHMQRHHKTANNEEMVKHLERTILMNILDEQWKEHLATMDYLRQSIHLRGYAQKNPIHEYKKEAFALFQRFLSNIKYKVISQLCSVKLVIEERKPEMAAAGNVPPSMPADNVNRNQPCPCGTGKKYKHCCGKL
ncbi:MAG: preprotein translocase subunit SecA [Gammaproteobacteria bacterium]|nr:preprotein translocase subunit SecA [Gammaproteobacteria bacterium]